MGRCEGTDRLTGMEDVRGTDGDDTITCDDAPNLIQSGGGTDSVFGLGGDDHLEGTSSSSADGGDGFDTCVGYGTTVNCEA
jgi:hypothetical protein